jgi:hypothetical protein
MSCDMQEGAGGSHFRGASEKREIHVRALLCYWSSEALTLRQAAGPKQAPDNHKGFAESLVASLVGVCLSGPPACSYLGDLGMHIWFHSL